MRTSPTLVAPSQETAASLWVWALALVMAVAIYFYGLGGQYIPTNGDELVYAHIARLTAASSQWLPLVSDLHQMRNTKPPMLFWQAMVAGGWGEHWNLMALRLPSVLYTLMTTGLIAWAVHGITGNVRKALLAACLYLVFFSTFRYGRPYLTSAPETFWLCLPLFFIIFLSCKYKENFVEYINQQFDIKNIVILIVFGVIFGLGSTYKSFALIAPAAAGIWLALVLAGRIATFKGLVLVSLQIGFSTVLAVVIFALWFVLDPNPAAVWREFVVGENVGKMSDKAGYWHEALYGGGSSLWAQALSYVENAGLIAPLVIGLAVAGFGFLKSSAQGAGSVRLADWTTWPAHLTILLAWLLVWWLVFMLPSQRSARYVIPAMPALAIVLALAWEQIGRAWFLASGVLIVVTLAVLARVGWVMYSLQISTEIEVALMATGWLAVLVALGVGWVKPAFTRNSTLAAGLLVWVCFSLTVAPMEGPSGRYSAATQSQLTGKTIAVPSNFNAQWERFEFLLPGNRIKPFDMASMGRPDTAQAALADLLRRHDAVVWGHAPLHQEAPICAPQCRVIATRWVVKERHQSGDITRANVWSMSWLFSREWIVVSSP